MVLSFREAFRPSNCDDRLEKKDVPAPAEAQTVCRVARVGRRADMLLASGIFISGGLILLIIIIVVVVLLLR